MSKPPVASNSLATVISDEVEHQQERHVLLVESIGHLKSVKDRVNALAQKIIEGENQQTCGDMVNEDIPNPTPIPPQSLASVLVESPQVIHTFCLDIEDSLYEIENAIF